MKLSGSHNSQCSADDWKTGKQIARNYHVPFSVMPHGCSVPMLFGQKQLDSTSGTCGHPSILKTCKNILL